MKRKTKHQIYQEQLDDAIHYISYGIKEGYFDEKQFEGMTEYQKMRWAHDAMNKADLIADRMEDDEETNH